ncbi:hypothetical protein [Ornithinibacillus sp. JPR2-1]|uniref:hypothetical protein n=1 Tax=Ornithinibacillus sp. JPR2-1 TaxID=2094019 RepID=UPI0031DA4AFF
MEKIGLFFRVPNTYGKVLLDLLDSLLDEDEYIWKKGNHIEILFSDDFNSEMKYIDRLKTLSNDPNEKICFVWKLLSHNSYIFRIFNEWRNW